HRGAFQFRILPDFHFHGGPRTDQQDQQADHRGQDRPVDKNVGKFHYSDASWPDSSWISTRWPARSLSRPLATTVSPSSRPDSTAARPSRTSPVVTERRLTISSPLSFSSTTYTKLP